MEEAADTLALQGLEQAKFTENRTFELPDGWRKSFPFI
jgi:hypothetical protein